MRKVCFTHRGEPMANLICSSWMSLLLLAGTTIIGCGSSPSQTNGLKVKLPPLSDKVMEGKIVDVKVKVGDEVKTDQSLVEVKTEKTTVTVPAPVSGRITQVLIKKGDTVKDEQVLVLIEANPEVSVSVVIARTVTDYEDFPGRLDPVNSIDIRSRVTGFLAKVNFKEGSIVKKGEVLFEIDERPYKAELERTQGIVLQMQGRLERLKADFARAEMLLPKDAVSREDYDKIVGDKKEAEGNLQVAKANQETANLKLGWTKVEAPLTGRVSRRFIDPGNLVKEDETILTTIVDLDPIYAYFDVDERTTLRFQKLIRAGWTEEAKLPVYVGLADEEKVGGDYKGFPHRGTIHFADNKIDWETGTWRLRGLFENKNLYLSPGLFVRIRLPIGIPHKEKLISEQALGADQGQKFVYVVDDENVVSYRRVVVGRLHHGLRAITAGLEVGDKVIVSGLQRARPLLKVNPKVVPMPGQPDADNGSQNNSETMRPGDKDK
jgi:RND family efflux transporter MFP subunit